MATTYVDSGYVDAGYIQEGISIFWDTRVIFIPKSATTLLQSSPSEIRELDLDVFRLILKDLEDDEEGMIYPVTHNHVAPITVGGVTLARVVELINNYTVTFEDGPYAVNLAGANSNIGDRVNVNQVSVRSSNSAGLVHAREIEAGIAATRVSVESLRPTHQGYGSFFYVDIVGGNDTNRGDSVSQAFLTVQHALDVAESGRGDVIFLLAPSGGVVNCQERLVINKEDLHLRGPGRGFQFQALTETGQPAIEVTANNCSLSGFVVRAPVGSIAEDCMHFHGKHVLLEKLYVVGSSTGAGHGIVFYGGDYSELHDVESEKHGGSGIVLQDGLGVNGATREVTISGGNVYLNGRDGIECIGNMATAPNSTRLIRIQGVNIHDNARYGVSVDTGVRNVFLNDYGRVHTNGTDIFDPGGNLQYIAEFIPSDRAVAKSTKTFAQILVAR